MEFDDDGVGVEGGTGENSVAKPKAPRVKKEKKEPGQFQTVIVIVVVTFPVSKLEVQVWFQMF